MDFDNPIITQHSLNSQTARNLSHSTKSIPMMEGITPRWLLKFLPWVPVEAGVYKVNKIKKHDIYPEMISFDNSNIQVGPKQMAQIPFFQNIDMDKMNTLSSLFHKKEFDAGNFICEGAPESNEFLIVANGKIEITTKGLSGEKLNIDILSSGDYTNVDAFVNNSMRPIYIKALTPCTVFSLNKRALTGHLDNSPQLAESINNAVTYWLSKKKAVNENQEKLISIKSGKMGEYELPHTYPDYEESPREYILSLIQTILKTNSNVTDIFNSPINQLDEQVRLTIEAMRERQEWEILNNKDFGLLNNVCPSMKVHPKDSSPTPDDMDELLSRVWKKPAFFLAHPKAIAAFGRECTRRGVPPPTVNIYGSPFVTWRGVPIVPCDKLMVNGKCCHNSYHGSTNILLLRAGEKEQGVIGLHQPGIPNETGIPSLSMKFAGIDQKGLSSYILSLYFSAAVLSSDAIGMLENVEVGKYYDCE
ncbi:family 2B encapsulin nanocompartment shell protein [Pseudobacteroides cellulosolvens]|uniref:Putative transcriptional regulator, Crp/Fnr family n=1 Tax=Pseudobacteroides cellulosolvens ATCC 35603 = DSM 2933 TaxID=398512 RepID=A0A0L6JR70_9FIRM|nr:family 2B encapsulin nanocompartment shell protein [Pseudobacteroides cellulosolvens]KNY28268.1 putative transcriptional regulator, Crp/Fnr family [Pseudobacteroides cellulosolvens ATCC 35603 = DSM 2933]